MPAKQPAPIDYKAAYTEACKLIDRLRVECDLLRKENARLKDEAQRHRGASEHARVKQLMRAFGLE
jgi:hypothetical protein